MRKLTTEEFIEKARKVHGDKYEYPDVYKGSANKINIKCPNHDIFTQSPNSHLRGNGCPKCGLISRANIRRKDFNVFITESNLVHNSYYIYTDNNYINTETKIEITCPIHGEFPQTPHNHLQGDGCPNCGLISRANKRRKDFNEFVEEANLLNNGFYSYNDNNYINAITYINITCPIHGEFSQTPHAHLKGQGCPKCAGLYKTYNDLITNGNITHDNKYTYPDNYNGGFIKYNDDIEIICPNKKHGSFHQNLSNHLNNATGCPKCNSSKGELKTEQLLKDNNINYITQQTFKGCKDKRLLKFDFYLPDINTCIEYDGIQHFNVIEAWGGEENLNNIQKRDKIKSDYCLNNSIKLLRIRYDENIIDKLKGNYII